MIHRYCSLAAALCLLCASCATLSQTATQTNVLPATALQPLGRYRLTEQQNLELISSAAHFGYRFQGRESKLYVSVPDANSHSYLQYELDGVYQRRVKVSGGATEPILIQAPTAGEHTVWVYKTTESHTGPLLVEKVTGQEVAAVPNPDAPLIEFIGNSITCGAAADPSEVPCGSGAYHDQHNAYMAYGPRVARALHANFLLSCVSGIGVYRNWNSNGPTMPEVYAHTDLHDDSMDRWDFSTNTPEVVSIALGTNDFSTGDGKNERLPFDSASFVSHYIDFVQLVKSKYPQAQIALLSSPMVHGENNVLLQHCLTAVKQHIDAGHPTDKPVAVFFFEPMEGRGCGGHPNVEDHGIMADALVPFFRKLLPTSAP